MLAQIAAALFGHVLIILRRTDSGFIGRVMGGKFLVRARRETVEETVRTILYLNGIKEPCRIFVKFEDDDETRSWLRKSFWPQMGKGSIPQPEPDPQLKPRK